MPCSSPPLSPALIAVVSLVVTRPSWVVNETLTRWMMHIHCCRHRPAGSVSTLTAKVHPPRILDPPTTDHRGRWLNYLSPNVQRMSSTQRWVDDVPGAVSFGMLVEWLIMTWISLRSCSSPSLRPAHSPIHYSPVMHETHGVVVGLANEVLAALR